MTLEPVENDPYINPSYDIQSIHRFLFISLPMSGIRISAYVLMHTKAVQLAGLRYGWLGYFTWLSEARSKL
jgi:hypothetical protein